MIMTGRTAELLELRTGDCQFSANVCMLIRRDTKIGGRIGVTEEVSVLDKFLLPRLRRQVANTLRGHVLVGMTATQFRKLWKEAIHALGLPSDYQPYGLRRGGATSWFQSTNSFARVADRGRWRALKAMRLYITTALQDWASDTMPHEVRHNCGESAKRLWQLKW